jgi:peroxiredoxin
VDTVAITAVNDHMVMNAWKNTAGPAGKEIEFLADGGNEFAKAVDLNVDLTGAGMGVRSKRYSMLVEDGVVKKLNIEEPGKYEVSGGDVMLKQL